MKNKAPLALMEQLVMVLVFALAAALCLQVFVFADRVSRRCEAEDYAVRVAQSAAEVLKSTSGDFGRAADMLGGSCEDGAWKIGYDKHWLQTTGDAAYWLEATAVDSGHGLLGMADVMVETSDSDELFRLTVAWQEGEEHAHA